jgi:hypothetical protein
LEAISKIEKWFEIKPPAPLPARKAYTPEGRAYALSAVGSTSRKPEGTVCESEEYM